MRLLKPHIPVQCSDNPSSLWKCHAHIAQHAWGRCSLAHILWRPQSFSLAEAFFGGSTACKFLVHTRTHIYARFTLPLLCHMLLPPPTLFPVHRTHTRLRLTLLARRLAQNPQPAQKEKGIKKSFKLSGIMPPTQEVIRLTKGVHHLSQGLWVMLWQFTFLTPFNAHLQLVEGSQPLFFAETMGPAWSALECHRAQWIFSAVWKGNFATLGRALYQQKCI